MRSAPAVAVLIAALLLAGCSRPALNANLRVTPDGVRVVPSVSGAVGGIGVSVSP